MMKFDISLPTYEVTTADPGELAFSAELATHSIYSIIETTSTTVEHNLGYVPKVWVFVVDNDGADDYLSRIPIAGSLFSADYKVTDTDIELYASDWTDFVIIIFTRSPNP